MKPCWWHDLTLCWFFMSFHVAFQPNSVALIFKQPWMPLQSNGIRLGLSTCHSNLPLWLPTRLTCPTYMVDILLRHHLTLHFHVHVDLSCWFHVNNMNLCHVTCLCQLNSSLINYNPLLLLTTTRTTTTLKTSYHRCLIIFCLFFCQHRVHMVV